MSMELPMASGISATQASTQRWAWLLAAGIALASPRPSLPSQTEGKDEEFASDSAGDR